VSTDDAKQDAITIMNTWGVGRKGVNDGLVVLFDMDTSNRHGQIYLYGGKGFNELYLDADECQATVDEQMLPKAKDGDLNGALLAGMQKIDHVAQPNGNPDRGLKILLNTILTVLVGGVGVLLFMLFLREWWEHGRDAEVPLVDDSVLMPTPPPGLTPALATALRKEGVDKDAFTSALVDLGHRGLVNFVSTDGDDKHVDLVIPPEEAIDPNSLEARRRPLGSAESDLASLIRVKAGGSGLSWTELKAGEGAKLYASFKKSLGRAAKTSGFFKDDPNSLPAKWIGAGVGAIVLVVVFGFFFAFDLSDSDQLFKPGKGFFLAPMLLSIGLAVLTMILSGRLVARTESGAQALGMAIGYRNTLRYELKKAHTVDEAVEETKTRLPWITTPDLLTVWAVAFGLKDEIDDLIKETFETARSTGSSFYSPVWYSGGSGISSIGSLSSSIGSMSVSPSSSGGSGFSGGGGGGGGGGF
jgi:uncharacterized membrane protein YgcG